MKKYLKTSHMAFLGKMNGGVLYLIPPMLSQAMYLIPMLFLWRVALSSGVEAELSLPQMLSYTWLASVLADLLVVKTPATGWLSEGELVKLYGRPLSVLGQLVAQTFGGWLPNLLIFSLPMLAIAPLFGISVRPVSAGFWVSLFLCVSLGFAIDFIFACLSIRLKNKSWLVERVRMAVVSVLSGTVIPMRLLPFGIGKVLKYQPFASLGGAPLSVFVGAAEVGPTVAVQLFWNITLWACALYAFGRSQERMASYGG